MRRCASRACRTPNRSGAIGPTGRSPRSEAASARRSRAGEGPAPSCSSRSRASPSATASRSAFGSSGTARPFWRRTQPASGSTRANGVSNTPSSSVPASESVRRTHQAVSPWTAIRAVPCGSPICHGRGTLWASTSKSGGQPEVALAARREADVASDPGDAERANRGPVEILADDVPDALVEPERIRVERAFGHLVALRRPVRELDRALLGDRGLELRQAAGELGRVVRRADAHPLGRVGARVLEPGPAEREVLQREPQWLGVGELAVEVEQRRLQRRELVVLEVEPVEEVVLRAEGVELLARELVALRVERHPEPGELRAIRVEAAGERLVRHLRVTLDVPLHVTRGQRSALRHQEGHERELTDELVGVVRHRGASLPLAVARDRGSGARPRAAGARLAAAAAPTPRATCALRDAGATGSSRGSGAACAGRPCPCASSPCSGRSRRRRRRPRSAAR